MKSIVLLSLVAVLASGLIQTVNVPITLFGNTNGSLTISAGNYGSVTLSAGTKSAVQGLLGVMKKAMGSVKPGAQVTFNLPIAINDGSATVVVNGKPFVVDAASIKALAGMFNQLNMVFSGANP
ncbi:hypothetical protein pipiens_001703 [Culex pipiens pipiens]|uniref:Uncharacterized protein n=1 Tax=Culex pipiens pipiens TaxID=38569 RepID=A0ABD1CAN7_CULPP